MKNSNTDAMALEELSLNDLHFDDAEFRDPRLDAPYSNHRSEPAAESKSIIDRFKSISSMSEILRVFGACAVIASMSLFMLSGWDENNDTQRYMMLLGQTGLLTAAGIALSYFLKEFKGARVFFGLALISVVANFTILGSLLYSVFSFDFGLAIDYPTLLTWRVDDISKFLTVFGFAIVLLPVLSYFAMSIFARRIATPLTIGFLIFNCLLLLPVRGSVVVSALVIWAFIAAAYLVKKLSGYQEVVFTPETKFALAALFIPGLILLARSFSLYTIDGVLEITLNGLAYFAIRSLILRMTQASFIKRGLEIAQYALGVNIGFLVTELLPDTYRGAAFAVVLVAFVADQIYRSNNRDWTNSLLNFTVIVLVGVNTLLALQGDDLILQLLSIVCCGGLFLFSQLSANYVNTTRFSRTSALVGAAICLSILTFELIGLFAESEWIVVGFIGMLLIICASLYERYGLKLMGAK